MVWWVEKGSGGTYRRWKKLGNNARSRRKSSATVVVNEAVVVF
jgi:hypothetical protein